MAHELGHNLGMHHYGDSRAPTNVQRNFSVAHPSLMNYAYSYSIGPDQLARFSRGTLSPIDPEGTSEASYSPGGDKGHFGYWPYYLHQLGDAVDFDRDGRVNPQEVIFDPGPVGQRGSLWADTRDVRAVDTRVPTGGTDVAVEYLNASGSVSRVYVVAPYSHNNGVYPEISWTVDTVGSSTPSSFGAWKPSSPLPGGADPAGEPSATLVFTNSQIAVMVTMPGADGRLYYAHYFPGPGTWSSWTAMPGWPAGARARNATVLAIDGATYVVFRSYHLTNGAVDNDAVPNVYLTRFDASGAWQPWELLATPSYVTPGLTWGPDMNLYLLGMGLYQYDGGQWTWFELSRRPIASDTGEAFQPVSNLGWPDPGLGYTAVPVAQRARNVLKTMPLRHRDGSVFDDHSVQLAAYWVTGRQSTDPSVFVQDGWTLQRAYTPGYIDGDGPCFGKTIDGGTCDSYASLYGRFQKDIDRPWPGYSVGVAARWNVLSATYVDSVWENDATGGFTPSARPAKYQPWANGISKGHGPLLDYNDAAVLRDFTCTSLYTLENQTCKCKVGPGSC